MISPREGWAAAAAKLGDRLRWQVKLLPGRRRLRRLTTGRAVGDARRLEPVSRNFGWDRGQPIDRHYIGDFLSTHTADIAGRVLEVGDDRYTRRFGHHVQRTEVIDINPSNRRATIVSDLATGEGLPSDSFDCMVLAQTLPFVFDLRGAIAQAHRALVDGGVVLATLPGISQVCHNTGAQWHDHWRFTETSARRVFAEHFAEANVTVTVYGNLASACAFLEGRATEELSPIELDRRDADYPVLLGVRALKRR